MNKIEISRKYYFSAGEDSHSSEWGTGANWELEVKLAGPIDTKSGLVVNLIDLDDLVKPCLKSLDKKHLNREVAFFKDKTVSPSLVAKYCYDCIQQKSQIAWQDLEDVCLVRVKASKPVLGVYGIYGQSKDNCSSDMGTSI